MSKDMMDTHAKVGAARARSEGRASDAEEELLVDENGDLLQADTQSKPPSVHEGSFAADHDDLSLESEPGGDRSPPPTSPLGQNSADPATPDVDMPCVGGDGGIGEDDVPRVGDGGLSEYSEMGTPSPARAPFDDGDDNFMGGSPSTETPSRLPASPPGPESWAPQTKVRCSQFENCDAVFIRMGNAADFVNDGRARIQYERIKKGAKYKKEQAYALVKPETLTLLEPVEAAGGTVDSTPKRSPRVAEQRAAADRSTVQLAAADGSTVTVALPERAAIERKRKLEEKKEAAVRGRQKVQRQSYESKVPVEERIEQFKGHSLVNEQGMVKCQACNFFPANTWSSINAHCRLEHNGQPTRHATKLEAWKNRKVDDSDLKTSLVQYFASHEDESSGTRNEDHLLYRYRVAESFTAHPPFSGIDDHRRLLERSGVSVPDHRHLTKFIPRIEEEEDKLINAEIAGQYIGVAFDGTTRLGEAINTTGRWCTHDFKLVKRLLDFTTLKKHVDNVQLAAHITNLLMQQRQVPLTYVVNLARDSVSVNGAACRRLKLTFTSAADSLCFCHTLCHVGEHFELPTLKEFKTPWLELAGGRDPHHGAKALWKETVAPATVPGYSKVRWYSWAEILFVIAEAGMRRLGDFISTCEERDYGDATTKTLRHIYDTKPDALRLELAATLDMRTLVAQTYALEGDRLEVLLVFDRIEALRALGRSISAKEDGMLPNVDAVLRRLMVLKKGVKIEKHFHGHGTAVGTLTKKEKVDSTLYPDHERDAWLIKYEDDHKEHYEEEELRSAKYGPVPNGQDGKPVLIVRNLPERNTICDALKPGFDYLEARLTGTCDAQYSLVEMYELCRVSRAFDPTFASANVNAAFVDSMGAITPLRALGMLDELKQQLPQYLTAAASAPTMDKNSVEDYSDAILQWWRNNGKSFPAWALAARITFAISPNSASCERVFALLKNLFGDQQTTALADYLQSALKLNYNGRVVG